MCSSMCCRCGPSVAKIVHVIAIVDLMTSVVFVTYEATNFGVLTGLMHPRTESENCTNCTVTLKDYIPKYWKFNFETFTVMTLIILVFLGFIIEGFLYSKLKTGKRDKIHLFCKKWFEFRVALLLITVFMALAKALRGFYVLEFDGVIDVVTKLYRIITIYIVKCFMNELEDTVGVVYTKPPRRPKRGSLALK
ncbi:unnamed protein product [Orchesella dallaii]|uniref:Uncharacterized protein n=1 Tax=Orchesella dallaii TaxID=48710 RepID=A0ABP1RZQ5_9HEXA